MAKRRSEGRGGDTHTQGEREREGVLARVGGGRKRVGLRGHEGERAAPKGDVPVPPKRGVVVAPKGAAAACGKERSKWAWAWA